jgi:hypothetical protein
MRKYVFVCAAALLAPSTAWQCLAADTAKVERKTTSPTAFNLIKEGNRYIGEQAKNKVLQIRSERSSGGIVPNVWHVVYFDSTASFKATEVKFKDGKMIDVKRPLRLLEATGRKSDPFPKEKLKVDSDEALKIATTQSSLENLTLTSTEMRLDRGQNDDPIWKIQVWASGPKDPKYETSIGDISVSAVDGKVIESDLKPEKARDTSSAPKSEPSTKSEDRSTTEDQSK